METATPPHPPPAASQSASGTSELDLASLPRSSLLLAVYGERGEGKTTLVRRILGARAEQVGPPTHGCAFSASSELLADPLAAALHRAASFDSQALSAALRPFMPPEGSGSVAGAHLVVVLDDCMGGASTSALHADASVMWLLQNFGRTKRGSPGVEATLRDATVTLTLVIAMRQPHLSAELAAQVDASFVFRMEFANQACVRRTLATATRSAVKPRQTGFHNECGCALQRLRDYEALALLRCGSSLAVAVLPSGQAPVDNQAPDDGQVPVDGQAPIDGLVPPSDQVSS